MLGLPSSPGAVGAVLLVLGVVVGLAVVWRVARGAPGDRAATAIVALCLGTTVGAGPFVAWRIVEDIRFTSSLDDDYRRGAGPIDSYLQPYLLDPVAELLPRDATYHAVVAASGIRDAARSAFRPLALTALFPRRSVSSPGKAGWIVAWGIDPRTVADVRRVVVAREAQAGYPPVYVAEVRH